jgi:tetratricopeptide (TPR) repeat protein
MNTKPAGPRYIPRAEEGKIDEVLSQVRADGGSRAVLLHGHGGIGKTSIVRHMAEGSPDAATDWVRPIDSDDPEVWLLSNLERRIVRQIDPGGRHFGPYLEHLSRLDSYPPWGPSHEAVAAYLGRIKKVFVTCYLDYIEREHKTVVIVFDTVETIRGTTLLLTLTQWMKELRRGTLFVLSGRAVAEAGAGEAEAEDPIAAELSTQYQGIPVTAIEVREFSLDGTRAFIDTSPVARGLRGDERDKLVLLSRGHPLWLAIMENYLAEQGVPEEASTSTLRFLEDNVPFDGRMTDDGQEKHDQFVRRLLSPYRDSDFWREAVKRLAIVRQPVARAVWERLMSDLELPSSVPDLDQAWTRLLDLPWMRPRGDRRYVTVHDALAEELSQRLFPLHDQDQRWRHRIWASARGIYDDLAAALERELSEETERLDAELRTTLEVPGHAGTLRAEMIDGTSTLSTRLHELDLYRAAGVYYHFLTDFADGCEQLLARYERAGKDNDTYFQNLIVLYLQRFLPGGTPVGAFNDVVRLKLEEFRAWLAEQPERYITLALLVARHLIETSQADTALRLLDNLPDPADHLQRHRINLLSGNACLRIPSRVREGREYFDNALAQAKELTTPDSAKLIAEAHKELGFYYRNTGQWWEADRSYSRARDALSTDDPVRKTDRDREEIASIQTNWAYVKGLNGSHLEASELAESAISIRRRLGDPATEGLSWSVRGEVYRYARRFEMAWSAYEEAERLLGRRHAGRLGFVRQQQAICLYQALQDGIRLTDDPRGDATALITMALGICQMYSIRAYPSALNRAGRIFAESDPDLAMEYLREGISEAKKLSDGWFWYANLIEFAELSYSQWEITRSEHYRQGILALSGEIEQVSNFFMFPDLSGRWRLIMGQLAVADYEQSGDEAKLAEALEHYKDGFASIAVRNVGSSGAAAIPAQFAGFKLIFSGLPDPVKADWLRELHVHWSRDGAGSTLLLARLEELY